MKLLRHFFSLVCLSLCVNGQLQAAKNDKPMLPQDLLIELGAAAIPDRETFLTLAHIGQERGSSTSKDVELIKFIVNIQPNQAPLVYWINTNNINMHPVFMQEVGIDGGFGPGMGKRDGGRRGERGADAERSGPDDRRGRGGRDGKGGRDGSNQSRGERGSLIVQGRGKEMKTVSGYSPETTSVIFRGDMSYLADETAPNGTKGLYTYNLDPRADAPLVAVVQQALLATLPIAQGKLAYRLPASDDEETYQQFARAGVAVHSDTERFIALNTGVSMGQLRYLNDDKLPSANDIVIAKTLPNELPRVAGVITAVRQTPLSHVNLRAVQDKIPNAYIAGVLENSRITSLIGQYVRYSVNADGYELEGVSSQEVEQYLRAQRPAKSPVLKRDLSAWQIKPLSDLTFADSVSVGAKAANVAALKHIGLPAETVPDGFAVPFYFYDTFMQHNGFYAKVDALLADKALIADKSRLEKALKALRKEIKQGDMPASLMAALEKTHQSFPEGSSLRCRSSTNNEDLAHFSGAGLYDSYTHHPHEGHLAKSIKQVYASLWNFRAFEARERYGVDHQQVAMGVLIHPNFKDELANGVAVTQDVRYGSAHNYYVNAQHGEDLVTNPDALSTPEELLIADNKGAGFRLLTPAADKRVVLVNKELDQLREYLGLIEREFSRLYQPADDSQFAMEIEFKVTAQNKLVIKQARPWIF